MLDVKGETQKCEGFSCETFHVLPFTFHER